MFPVSNLLRLFAACSALLLLAPPAHALPSFARQTGEACTACHVGGFGPQLTPHGMKFKIGGYTDWDGSSSWMPMSAHAIAGYTRVRGSNAAGVDKINSDRLNEASIFAAGRVNDHLGGFVQVTWDGIGHEWGLDHTDLRLVDTGQVAGKELVYGLSLNNNPTVQDPFNTLTVWGFPYTGSGLAGGPSAASLVNGRLEHTVGGLTLYGFLDNSIYAEVGTYRTLAPRTQVALGEGKDSDPGRLGDGTLYWRTAYFRDLKRQAFAVGLFGMNGGLHARGAVDPASVGNFHDVGVDAMYQYLGSREHIGTLNATYLRETVSSAGDRGHLNEFKANASYFFRNTYGVSLGYFSTTGNALAIYSADPANPNSPNSRGFITELSWTPFGKEDSWMAPWANVRLGLQYINFQRLDGQSGSYPRGNNTLFGYVWTAF